MYTHYKLIGWYAFGSDVQQAHLLFHQTIATFRENPVFLLIDDKPNVSSDSDRLPLSVFVREGEVFVEVPFAIETSQVEKIALDQIMKATPSAGLSALEVQNQSVLSSLTTLGKKVDVIVAYLEGVRGGRFAADQTLIRKAAKICQMLPTVDSDQFERRFSEEVSDALMATYLSAVTRTLHSLSTTTDSYTSLYGEKKSSGGMGMGMGMF